MKAVKGVAEMGVLGTKGSKLLDGGRDGLLSGGNELLISLSAHSRSQPSSVPEEGQDSSPWCRR